MFNSLFKKKEKPVYDPALGDALARVILNEARDGKIDTALREISKQREGMWDQRAFYVDLVGEHLINAKAKTFPDSPIGNLIKGTYAIHRAWAARGSGIADTVTGDGWNSFFKRLSIGKEALLQSAKEDSQDPTPLAFLQTVAMGLELERETAQLWLNEATKRDPLNQQAHYRHLFLLCEKWGGSHKEMYSFAYATLEKLPANSTLGSIIYLAYQEHFLYLFAFDKNRAAAKALLQDSSIRQESIKVYRKFFDKRPLITNVSDYWPHNVTVWWLHALGERKIVRQEVKKIGPYFTRFPWSMFYKNPAEAYFDVMKY